MSCSKPLPPFVCDSLYHLTRDQLERFLIVCRPLRNFIDRYFHSRPYRIFDRLCIRGGSYALIHNHVQWHPNRDDYSVQQFLGNLRENRLSKIFSKNKSNTYEILLMQAIDADHHQQKNMGCFRHKALLMQAIDADHHQQKNMGCFRHKALLMQAIDADHHQQKNMGCFRHKALLMQAIDAGMFSLT